MTLGSKRADRKRSITVQLIIRANFAQTIIVPTEATPTITSDLLYPI